jgi:DNA-binding CsgD family transcriptional regulator
MLVTGLTDLVALGYEAACDPPRMTEFVRGAAEHFAAQGCGLLIWPHGQPDFLLPITHGLDPDAAARLLAARRDPGSLLARLDKLEPGMSVAASESGPPSPGRPAGHALLGLVESDARNGCAILLTRETGHDPFSAAARNSLERLMAFLRRAIAMNAGYTRLYARHRTAERLLDGAPRGIVFVGQRQQLTYQNGEARRILGAGDGIDGNGGSLRLGPREAQIRLDDFLAATAAGQTAAPLALRVDRPSARPAYQLVLYPMVCTPGRAALNPDEALAVALLHDPDSPQALSAELLKTFFHLTPAEAHLTQALYGGEAVGEAAALLGISVNTARTHLRSIFAKVGVNSQAALIQQISHSLRVLARDGNPVD